MEIRDLPNLLLQILCPEVLNWRYWAIAELCAICRDWSVIAIYGQQRAYACKCVAECAARIRFSIGYIPPGHYQICWQALASKEHRRSRMRRVPEDNSGT